MRVPLILKKRIQNKKVYKNRRILLNNKVRNGLYVTQQKHPKHFYQIDSASGNQCQAKTLFDFEDCPNPCTTAGCTYCFYHLRIKDLLMYRRSHAEYYNIKYGKMGDFIRYTRTYWEKIFPTRNIPPFNMDDAFWLNSQRVNIRAGRCGVRKFDNTGETCGRPVNRDGDPCDYHHIMIECTYAFYHFKEGNPLYPNRPIMLTKDVMEDIIDEGVPNRRSLIDRLTKTPFNISYYLQFFLRLEHIIITQILVDEGHVYACFVLLRKATRDINSRNYAKSFEFLNDVAIRQHLMKLKPYCNGKWFDKLLHELFTNPANFRD